MECNGLFEGKKDGRRVDAMLSVEGPGGEGVRTAGRELTLAKRRGTGPLEGERWLLHETRRDTQRVRKAF